MHIITSYFSSDRHSENSLINALSTKLFNNHNFSSGAIILDPLELKPFTHFLDNFLEKIVLNKISTNKYELIYGNAIILLYVDNSFFTDIKSTIPYSKIKEFPGILDGYRPYGITPIEYSFNRAMSSCNHFQWYLNPFINSGEVFDFSDLEEEITQKFYELNQDKYKPIQYDWMEVDKIKEKEGLQTKLFEGPFLLMSKCKTILQLDIAKEIAKEMKARTIFLQNTKFQSEIHPSAVTVSDFIRRSGLNEVTDIAKKHFDMCIIKTNEVPIRKGKRSNITRDRA